MVVFTCGHCGESVQKPKVEKHYLTKCRNRNPNLSCMDCFKDFLGNDYEAHTKCITEEERYSGKGFTAKEKKGEKKQNAWVEMLQSVLDEQKNTSRNVLRIIETISKHNNTPRKKPKFINFVKNVCGHKTNPKDIDQAWDLISVKLTELSNLNAQNRNQNLKDIDDEPVENGSAEENNQNCESLNGKLENGKEEEDKEGEDDENNTVTEDKSEIPTEKEENKKLSKKQRKEEKKRKKYEAELLSAEAPPEEPEVDTETVGSKKGKKKNKENVNGNNHDVKEKKRKRQDTVPTVEVPEVVQDIESETLKVKASMKKLKMENEADANKANESICLHDQNVALGEREAPENNGKFDWHAVIISVLEKKGNELPFKRLQKRVLSEYSEFTGDEIDDRIADKFIKKLRSAPKVRVDKNRVLLLVDEE